VRPLQLTYAGAATSLCNIDHTNVVRWNGSAGASRSGRRRHPRGADQFRKQAKECRQLAATSLKAVDKAFWLRLGAPQIDRRKSEMMFDGHPSSGFATGQEWSALLGSHTAHGSADNLRIVRFGEEQTALGYLNVLWSNMA
jgi:hypothetical protein